MLFPVYVYEEGVELPDEGTYYVIAGNGTYLHKDTGLVRCFVKVKNVPSLPDLDAASWVSLNLPKLPEEDVQKIKQFFSQVVKLHRTEASTTLYFNKETQTFKVHVPEQSVSHGGVQYTRKLTEEEMPEYEGYLRVGTIHSHCDFGAFHSGTDVGDEEDFDGLHVTFGNNGDDEFTISASVVVNGKRTKVDPLNVLDGIKHVRDDLYVLNYEILHDEPDEWMKRVRVGWRNTFYQPRVEDKEIKAGDWVSWAGELKLTGWRQKFGDGPFLVESLEDRYLEIQTKAGLAHFPVELFKK